MVAGVVHNGIGLTWQTQLQPHPEMILPGGTGGLEGGGLDQPQQQPVQTTGGADLTGASDLAGASGPGAFQATVTFPVGFSGFIASHVSATGATVGTVTPNGDNTVHTVALTVTGDAAAVSVSSLVSAATTPDMAAGDTDTFTYTPSLTASSIIATGTDRLYFCVPFH